MSGVMCARRSTRTHVALFTSGPISRGRHVRGSLMSALDAVDRFVRQHRTPAVSGEDRGTRRPPAPKSALRRAETFVSRHRSTVAEDRHGTLGSPGSPPQLETSRHLLRPQELSSCSHMASSLLARGERSLARRRWPCALNNAVRRGEDYLYEPRPSPNPQTPAIGTRTLTTDHRGRHFAVSGPDAGGDAPNPHLAQSHRPVRCATSKRMHMTERGGRLACPASLPTILWHGQMAALEYASLVSDVPDVGLVPIPPHWDSRLGICTRIPGIRAKRNTPQSSCAPTTLREPVSHATFVRLHPDSRVAEENTIHRLPSTGINRRARAFLLRLRTGCNRTAERLFRQSGNGNPSCPQCRADETIAHILLQCPGYADHRRQAVRGLRQARAPPRESGRSPVPLCHRTTLLQACYALLDFFGDADLFTYAPLRPVSYRSARFVYIPAAFPPRTAGRPSRDDDILLSLAGLLDCSSHGGRHRGLPLPALAKAE
ncbi:hypothetical protein HPB52_024851 [Rhipicephalus sanguineus]|uniref:Tick transposon n=1 Tax=Rhipicephalus sanguineus TaxID=34632 RepID=A0A9D4YRX3_RHISA|nr:hypothetical protein HPB52_024851 [Rhipicephalus sanguineus]